MQIDPRRPRDAKGSGVVNCNNFDIYDSQFSIINKQLESVQHWNGSWHHPLEQAYRGAHQFGARRSSSWRSLAVPSVASSITPFSSARRLGYVIIWEQHQVELWLKMAIFWLEGTNTLKVLDDLGAGQTRHFREPRWHQRVGSDVAAFQHREAFQKECGSRLSVLHASDKTTKGIFVEYTAELNERKFNHLLS